MGRITDDLKRQLAYELAPSYGVDPEELPPEVLPQIGAITVAATRRAVRSAVTSAELSGLIEVRSRVIRAMTNGIRKPPTAEFGQAVVRIADLRHLLTIAERTYGLAAHDEG